MEVAKLDVADPESVKKFVEDWRNSKRPVHLLINNAGVFNICGEEKKHDLRYPCLALGPVNRTSQIVLICSAHLLLTTVGHDVGLLSRMAKDG